MHRHTPLVFAAAAAGALYLRERKKRIRIERLGAATLETLLDAIDANNPATGAHVRRVARYALVLAEAADLDERTQHEIERVALFHDIGKIDGALTDIVNEPTKLSPEEMREIRKHPRVGAHVLAPLRNFYPDLSEGVLSHHEKWDGSGYPRGLKGRRIPLSARIVMIADTFDAITHARSYRSGRSLKIASEIISQGRCTQFDPDLVDLFLSPPVISEISAMMRERETPRRAEKTRRGKPETQGVPDITFRWRTPRPQPHSSDR